MDMMAPHILQIQENVIPYDQKELGEPLTYGNGLFLRREAQQLQSNVVPMESNDPLISQNAILTARAVASNFWLLCPGSGRGGFELEIQNVT